MSLNDKRILDYASELADAALSDMTEKKKAGADGRLYDHKDRKHKLCYEVAFDETGTLYSVNSKEISTAISNQFCGLLFITLDQRESIIPLFGNDEPADRRGVNGEILVAKLSATVIG